MHPLQKRFQEFINEHRLLTKEDKILLGVSGGVDSMVLASLFVENNYNFTIAHCNYGLRGKDSNLDEDFVKKWSEKK